MVKVTAISPNTVINGFGVGIGDFSNPTPVELWDGNLAGSFPVTGTQAVSQISIIWEFGTTTGFGAYSVTDQTLDPQPVPSKLEINGAMGSMRVRNLTDTLNDTLIDGQTIAAAMPGTSNEEGFYRSLFQNDDVFKGGNADDFLVSYDGADKITGGNGADEIIAGKGNDDASGGSGNDRLFGEDGNDILNGDADDDWIEGGKGKDTINGGSGKDQLFGDEGRDTIKGGSGRDKVEGGAGNDNISGGAGRDRLKGGAGNDLLDGQLGNDKIKGGNGNDTLEGGLGNDILTGGAGDDLFVYRSFTSPIDLGEDVILDFAVGSDLLDFRQSDVFAGDVSIGLHADGTEIVISTVNTAVTIVLFGVDPINVSTDDFLFPVL